MGGGGIRETDRSSAEHGGLVVGVALAEHEGLVVPVVAGEAVLLRVGEAGRALRQLRQEDVRRQSRQLPVVRQPSTARLEEQRDGRVRALWLLLNMLMFQVK